MPEPVREQTHSFTLVHGGLVHRIAKRLPFAGSNRFVLPAIIAGIVAFLPIVVLAGMQNVLYGNRVDLPLIADWSVIVRFAIAIPLLILAERTVDRWLSEAVELFRSEGIVSDTVRPEFDAALQRLTRRLDSVFPELMLLALAFASAWAGSITSIGPMISTWRLPVPGEESSVTLAGQWLSLVSVPLFRFLMLRWFWRILLWTLFLRRVSRMNLVLVPTHPDGAAGLGFLGLAHTSFATLLVSLALTVGSRGVYWVLYAGGTLDALRNSLIAFLVLALLLTLGPLLVFVPKLVVAKRRGLADYGILASDYTHRFDHKWVRGGGSGEELLGTADIQSLADLGNSYATIRNMRIIPATLANALMLTMAAALPLLPVLAVIVPVEKILGVLLQLLG